MISHGSRYQNSLFGVFRWDDDKPRVIPMFPRSLSINDLKKDFFSYETRSGDELDSLAERYGDNFEDWWKIADVNHIKFPLDTINSGTFLTMPQKRFFNSLEGDNITILGR